MLKIKELRCYEAKIEESEKAGSCRELSPGDLRLEPPVLSLSLQQLDNHLYFLVPRPRLYLAGVENPPHSKIKSGSGLEMRLLKQYFAKLHYSI